VEYALPHANRLGKYLNRFIPPAFRSGLGRYMFRHRVNKLAQDGAELKLVIGAFNAYQNGWVPSEIDFLDLLNPEHWKTVFPSRRIDAILAEHVWEHLTPGDGVAAAQQCFDYLKPGGYVRIAVPDGYCPDKDYLNWVKPDGTGPGADDHKVLYNHKTLAKVFKQAGFKIRLLEYYDEKGKFNYVNWDPAKGRVYRSRRFDTRNANGKLGYTSLILDAHKP